MNESKIHNDKIKKHIKDYLRLPDPQYAILIDGEWGSGKTFYLKRWMGEFKADTTLSHFRFAYVSLYGVTSVQQIDALVFNEVKSFINAKDLAKFAKIIGSSHSALGGLATISDYIGKNPITDTPATGNDNRTKNKMLLIFDDLERAKLPIDEVLAYINYYNEHKACHVIIVGNEKMVGDAEQKDRHETTKDTEKFSLIKEKVISETYTIKPNLDEAISFFIDDLKKEKEFEDVPIDKEVVKREATNNEYFGKKSEPDKINLRKLRHALYTFPVFYNDLVEESIKIKPKLTRDKIINNEDVNKYAIEEFLKAKSKSANEMEQAIESLANSIVIAGLYDDEKWRRFDYNWVMENERFDELKPIVMKKLEETDFPDLVLFLRVFMTIYYFKHHGIINDSNEDLLALYRKNLKKHENEILQIYSPKDFQQEHMHYIRDYNINGEKDLIEIFNEVYKNTKDRYITEKLSDEKISIRYFIQMSKDLNKNDLQTLENIDISTLVDDIYNIPNIDLLYWGDVARGAVAAGIRHSYIDHGDITREFWEKFFEQLKSKIDSNKCKKPKDMYLKQLIDKVKKNREEHDEAMKRQQDNETNK